MDDRALLAAHGAGDPDAFGVLFTRHRDRLWAVALRTTGSPEDAADALQEAMISAFKRAADFRGDAQVTTWLHRIVVNASLDRLRRNKVRAAQPLPDDLEDYASRGAVIGSEAAATDPATAAVRADQRAAVLGALAELPADQRAALVLVDMEGYPVDEVARILGCPTGTVKSRCARGRRRLLGLLAETGITGTAPGTGASDQGTDRASTGGGAR
ncbi:RNA polymerase sigma factor SigM [Nocardioides marmoriginsengisoli]|uniref:RNA polymerase sigma factor SigM n=1 Tax=Nocardioides marmoriginsengisoli TaxID=661483 RepID=A0A3N0CBP4_9ACTN|nr:RNA polymerase sigma factor SigM [Nocardioides marmoriginsengisoli]